MTLDLNPVSAAEGPNPRMQPHVLVITGTTADEREYEIEHPDCCPIVCYWTPHMRETVEREKSIAKTKGHIGFGWDDGNGHRDCYVQYEIDNCGLDTLNLGEDPPDDGTYTPPSQWSTDDWRRLPPGRYIIEAWFHQGRGLMEWGEDESEGGLTFVGLEKARS